MRIHTRLLHFLSHLHDGEHAGFGANIVTRLGATLSAIALMAPLWETFESAVNHETLMFKISKASLETQEISETDVRRDRFFREVRHRLRFYAEDEDPTLKQAAEALLFLLKPYEEATSRSLFEETTFIRNFLDKIYEQAYIQFIDDIPSLDSLLAKLDILNSRLDNLYTQRLQTMEELKALGKRADVRIDVDRAFINLLEAINSVQHYLELSGTEPELKASLAQSAEYIHGLIEQLRKVRAHRTHHRRKPAETPPDDAAQKPAAATPPPTDKPQHAPAAPPPPTDKPQHAPAASPPPTDKPQHAPAASPPPTDKPQHAPAASPPASQAGEHPPPGKGPT